MGPTVIGRPPGRRAHGGGGWLALSLLDVGVVLYDRTTSESVGPLLDATDRISMTHHVAPHPRFRRSELFSGLEWVTESSRFEGTNSDMHWLAWTEDGSLYAVDDDGQNFGSPWNFANLLQVEGTPPDHNVRLVSQFPELVRPDDARCRRYVDGAVAVGDRVYVAAYDYDQLVPGFLAGAGLVDLLSPNGGVAGLMHSDDRGETWQNVPSKDVRPDQYFLGPRFAGLAFVQFGPGATKVPKRFGDHVYALSNDGNWETGDHVYLARVPRDRVADRSAWEFFASPGEGSLPLDEPTWSLDENRSRPVLRDPGRIGHPTMTYNPAIDRFLLAYSTDSVPHTLNTPPEVAEATWVKQTELLLFEGPTPWGPWGLVHHDEAWEAPHTPYLPQIPGKWLDADGRGGWMIFSGDYVVPGCQGEYYGFVTRRFTLAPRQ
jgi:hypothetical protein